MVARRRRRWVRNHYRCKDSSVSHNFFTSFSQYLCLETRSRSPWRPDIVHKITPVSCSGLGKGKSEVKAAKTKAWHGCAANIAWYLTKTIKPILDNYRGETLIRSKCNWCNCAYRTTSDFCKTLRSRSTRETQSLSVWQKREYWTPT